MPYKKMWKISFGIYFFEWLFQIAICMQRLVPVARYFKHFPKTLNNYTQYIGILSGTLTSLSLLPQLIKIIRERKAEGVSLGMFIVLLLGLGGWIWYGL